MIAETVVELSRWQFAITAILHFLFIPLTLGLALLLALAETAHVMTGRPLYKTMAHFWGRVFAINFVLAFATRLAVVFQFGMNGSYFSHYVGDIFALPLAAEALTTFFLASALFGPYWFGWDKLGKYQHLTVTWLIVIAVNVSAYWVLLANGWMQNPVAAAFNAQSYRMELTDFALLLNNPVALTKFIHTAAASYVSAMAVVMAISAYWLRSDGNDLMARRSYKLAASIGLIAIIGSIWLGDDTPTQDNPVQTAKRAALNGGSLQPLLPAIETRIRSGITAFTLLEALRDDNKDPQLLADFEQHKADLGYALLLKPWHKQIIDATDSHITLAAQSALPAYPRLLQWAYRLMLICGVGSLLLFIAASGACVSRKPLPRWLLNLSLYLLPLPWLACLAGWFVAEVGKQPWAIAGVLPTFLGVSSLSVKELIFSVAGYTLLDALLLGAGMFLMRQTLQNREINHSGAQS